MPMLDSYGLDINRIDGTGVAQPPKIIVPGVSDQIMPADNYDQITVKGDADLIAANIKSGVDIFGVLGTYVGTGRQFVSGITTSIQPGISFNMVGGGAPVALPYVSVAGLTFKPKAIMLFASNSTYMTVYQSYLGDYYMGAGTGWCIVTAAYSSTQTSGYLSDFIETGNLSVTATTFQLPVWAGNIQYNWIAFE
ncbi:hypothetical protein EJP77_04925 [Paenibacillus zeisoli]|uniref:Uncharacterized protein n=1 Tax=Paenibacillus zeisoli TaxID=2496267 RepID=A0A3S1D3Q1_9BACL|nr:hypothetical protein [Paenibacillus zeisoli]RUT36331.1 hypothetical protein EJP77_04925 [Paenibacillus zeisoli]